MNIKVKNCEYAARELEWAIALTILIVVKLIIDNTVDIDVKNII
ncbi:MAG: hypothetical protein SVN78_10980 [Deferribacterota bacterium]|nr:hypothetical protein [Deferribacterota bacterium]